jgi:type II secretory pathway pseudopilin PulG
MRLMPRRHDACGREAGASLVELLVVLVLVSVVGTMAVNGVVTAMRVSRQTEARVQAAAELQRATERITRDVRSACPMEVMEADELVGVVHPGTGTARRAIYRYDAATKTLVSATAAAAGPIVPSGETVVMTDVEPDGAMFTYFDDAGDPVTAAADVRTVRVALRRDLPEQDPVEVETMVALRNGGRACD